MPVSQINKTRIAKLTPTYNVFGWEKEHVTVHRLSEKEGSISRINPILINEHYSYVKRLNTRLHKQNRHNESKHFCKRCLHG